MSEKKTFFATFLFVDGSLSWLYFSASSEEEKQVEGNWVSVAVIPKLTRTRGGGEGLRIKSNTTPLLVL